MTDNTWDDYFMGMARYAAGKSKDRSTQVGAVIIRESSKAVLSTGWNGFPRGVDDNVPERHDRPFKYQWTEHAERNAIFNAAREGMRLEGATLYSTHFPCCDCARAIVQSGISRLVTMKPDLHDPHRASTQGLVVAIRLLDEGGVQTEFTAR